MTKPMGIYAGPPGDPTNYSLPAEFEAWERAWGAHKRGVSPKREVPQYPVSDVRRARRRRAMAVLSEDPGEWKRTPFWGTRYFHLTDEEVNGILKAERTKR